MHDLLTHWIPAYIIAGSEFLISTFMGNNFIKWVQCLRTLSFALSPTVLVHFQSYLGQHFFLHPI